MVKILSLLVLSLLLFAGGLAGALYMRPATDPAEAEGNGEVTPTSANAPASSGRNVRLPGSEKGSRMATSAFSPRLLRLRWGW